MMKYFLLLLTLLAFDIFSSGCAEWNKNVKEKCPECGTIFRDHLPPPSGF
jgi:hypothetical protein